MKMSFSFFLILLPVFAICQNRNINWVRLSSWKEVIALANSQHKYIFVDCYATWCGPCKIMDKDVFSNDLLADSINRSFIAVKMQMDNSDKDDSTVKSLYPDAQKLSSDYRVDAYPTFLFFDTCGIIKHKETGLKTVSQMIALSSEVLTKRDKYEDKYADYDRMVGEYHSGKKNYAEFPYMINTSELLSNSTLADQMTSEYFYFLKNKPLNFILKKDVLKFLEAHIALQSKYFYLFYKKHQLVDSVMGRVGYAREVVLQIIANEYTYPFLNRCNQDSFLIKDPPWSELGGEIKQFVDQRLIARNDLEAKIAWYKGQKDWPRYFDLYLKKVRTYGIDSSAIQMDFQINEFAWWVFEFNEPDSITLRAIELMEGAIRRVKRSGEAVYLLYDTYANLLYRSSRLKEAIIFENKAISNAKEWQLKEPGQNEFYTSEISEFNLVLDKMKNGKPTWTPN